MTTALISQKDAIERWPVLSECCLNEARRLGQIEWVRGLYRRPFYTEEAIEAYIAEFRTQRREQPKPAKPQLRRPPIPKDLMDKVAERTARRI